MSLPGTSTQRDFDLACGCHRTRVEKIAVSAWRQGHATVPNKKRDRFHNRPAQKRFSPITMICAEMQEPMPPQQVQTKNP